MRRRTRRGGTAALAGLALVLAAPACGSGGAAGTGEGLPHVVTTSYPLEHVVAEIGGDRVEVENLTARGADSHATELTPRQLVSLEEADLVVHLTGMQAGVDGALASQEPGRLLDAARWADREGDPHFWLDPERMAGLADEVLAQLVDLDPDGAEAYRAGAERLGAELDALAAEYDAALDGCRGATLVTAHEAFGYLADAHGLQQVGIAGIDPHVEPSPARLRDVAEVVREDGVRTVFFEASTSPEVARTLADDLGVTTAVLHPIERVGPEDTYADLMRANLAALEDGLVCRSGVGGGA